MPQKLTNRSERERRTGHRRRKGPTRKGERRAQKQPVTVDRRSKGERRRSDRRAARDRRGTATT